MVAPSAVHQQPQPPRAAAPAVRRAEAWAGCADDLSTDPRPSSRLHATHRPRI